MNFYKKNIILTPADYSNVIIENAVLSLEQLSNEEAIGTLKCNNLKNVNTKMLLGILVNNKIHKIEIPQQTKCDYCFSLPVNFEKCEKISCVLLAEKANNFKPIIWGSTETSKAYQTNILNAFDQKEKSVAINSINEQENVEQNIDNIEHEKSYKKHNDDDDNDDDIEEFIDKQMAIQNEETCDEVCDECIYKKEFYNNAKSESVKKSFINVEDKNIFKKGQGDNFFALIEGQVDELLEKYPLEDAITQIIPNSKFVRVDYNNDGTYYIFGVIYEEKTETPKFICYGIPAKFGDEAPTQIDGYYQWLPVDADNPEGEGYFVMYQNAETGENIKIEVI